MAQVWGNFITKRLILLPMLVARTQIIFDGVWGPSSETSTHFSPSKTADFYGFFSQNFCKSGLISKGFFTTKMPDFTIFSQFL